MVGSVEAQRKASDYVYSDPNDQRWAFHYTEDLLTRYLRDRRLHVALDMLRNHGHLDIESQSVLLVCGGVGGEGTFFANFGFKDVTVSDLSQEALAHCHRFDRRLKTRQLNAEDMADLTDSSYDLVIVQDGLHHLPRPALGFTEMLRVARHAVIVIEPHYSLVGKMIGTEWEVFGDAVNYVFRWNRAMLEQISMSYLLQKDLVIARRRFWDHNVVIARLVAALPRVARLAAARAAYSVLRPVDPLGNMMVGVVIKPTGPAPQRLTPILACEVEVGG